MKPLSKSQVLKILFIWIVIIGGISISNYIFVINTFQKIVILFFLYSIGMFPLWLIGYVYLNNKVAITREGKHIPNFKHGRIFEYVFFSFLFVASFLSTAFYSQNANPLYTGLMIAVFTSNALASGYFHYICHFHD